ncbi:MAG: permease-like cell division protein FtsX [Vulcanimicrobiota bacterium]
MSANHKYFFREVNQNFKRNVMLHISSIATVMVLIFQLGFFGLITSNLNNFSQSIMEKFNVTVVIVPDYNIEKIGQLKARILKHPNIEIARFIHRDVAYKKLKESLGTSIEMENLTNNPLPHTLELDLKEPRKIKELSEEVSKYPGVEEIRYGNVELVEKLIKLSNRIKIIGMVIIIILGISSVFLIANTIKLTVFSRRKEIAIMELVGASHLFIQGPFIVEGLAHGVLGSTIAIVLLNFIYSGFYSVISKDMPFIPVIPPELIAVKTSMYLLSAGILVSGVSSYISVNKYLKL